MGLLDAIRMIMGGDKHSTTMNNNNNGATNPGIINPTTSNSLSHTDSQQFGSAEPHTVTSAPQPNMPINGISMTPDTGSTSSQPTEEVFNSQPSEPVNDTQISTEGMPSVGSTPLVPANNDTPTPAHAQQTVVSGEVVTPPSNDPTHPL